MVTTYKEWIRKSWSLTKAGTALPKEAIEHSSQADYRKKGNHSQGNNLNGGVKAFGDQLPYGVHVEDTLLMEPHTHLYPHQTQSGIGPSDSSGLLWKNEESNKDGYTYVAQSPNEKPEKYSKVYRRQRVSHYKAPQLEPVAEETQGLEGVKDMAITCYSESK